MMANTWLPLALLAIVVVPEMAVASGSRNTALGVSVRVVDSCGVRMQDSTVGITCSRGGTDRVMVDTLEPRVVTLERDGRLLEAVVDAGSPPSTGDDRFLTLQF